MNSQTPSPNNWELTLMNAGYGTGEAHIEFPKELMEKIH